MFFTSSIKLMEDQELKCVICDEIDMKFLLKMSLLDTVVYCGNCFTISVQTNNKDVHNDVHYNKCKEKTYDFEYYKNFIYKKIDKLILENKTSINILNLNDHNTNILDLIYENYKHHTNIKCVSVSQLFYPSFFSKHWCYRDLTTCIKNFKSFDLILLNDTLNFVHNPHELLSTLRPLLDKDTSIVSTNYHSVYIPSFYFLNMKKNMKYIYNTNSIKVLAKKCDMKLVYVDKIDDTSDVRLFEIKSNDNLSDDGNIIETIYDDIVKETYDDETYDTIRYFWNYHYSRYTDIIQKYKLNDFKIIGIESCNCCEIRNMYNCDGNLDHIYKLKDITKLTHNVILVIFDYNNFKKRLKELNLLLSDTHSKHLAFDIIDLISYPI